MMTGAEGKALIKQYEKCVLTPYRCPAGIPTIGWGNTTYEDGRAVAMTDAPLTQERADRLFTGVLANFEREVNGLLTQPLKQHQFDALMCFAWNVGITKLKDSTLLKRINTNPEDSLLREQFMRWDKNRGKAMSGLTKRRKAEADLYFKK